MGEYIDISKFNKADVLATLYNHSRPLGMGFFHYTPKPMTRKQAQEILDSGLTYFVYLKGRVMKVDLKGDKFWPDLYDRDNGLGAAAAALEAIGDVIHE